MAKINQDGKTYSLSELISEYESEEKEMKSKQELIEKWESAIEAADFYGKGKEGRLIGYMKDFVSDLKQLDEPEVLSQELPVIPKFAADWIESRDYYNVYKALQDLSAPGSPHASKDVRNWIFRNQENVEKFVRAWLDGYEVEEEQKYFAKIKGHEKIDSDDKYWNYCIMDESLEIADNKVHADVLDEYVLNTTKDKWENLGINGDNADFVEVEEMEE